MKKSQLFYNCLEKKVNIFWKTVKKISQESVKDEKENQEKFKQIFEKETAPPPYEVKTLNVKERQYPIRKFDGGIKISGQGNVQEENKQINKSTTQQIAKGVATGTILNCYKDIAEALKRVEKNQIQMQDNCQRKMK